MKDNQDPVIVTNDKQSMLLKVLGSFAIFVIVILSLVVFKMYKANQVNDDLTGKARYEAKYLQRDLVESQQRGSSQEERIVALTKALRESNDLLQFYQIKGTQHTKDYAQACVDHASFLMNAAHHLMAYPGTTQSQLEVKFLGNYDEALLLDMKVWIEFLYNEKYYMMFGLSRNKGRVAEYEHLNLLNTAAQTMCINGQWKSSPTSLYTTNVL